MATFIRTLKLKELAETPQSRRGAPRPRIRRFCRYEGTIVLVDPKEYLRNIDPDGDKALENAKDIADLLNAEEHDKMGSLRCLGWVEDNGTELVYFVFELPPGYGENATFNTLHYYLQSMRPSATARLGLAKFLANALYNIHKAGYFHKGIRSHSVIFLQRSLTEGRQINHPKLIGFDFSRKSNPARLSEKDRDIETILYRHPSAPADPDSSFSHLHDYYSLGIVMIEIALWKPIKDVLGKYPKFQGSRCKPDDAMEIRGILLGTDRDAQDDHLQDVAFHLGDQYKDVVELCLNGNFGSNITASALLERVDERIIRPISACRI